MSSRHRRAAVLATVFPALILSLAASSAAAGPPSGRAGADVRLGSAVLEWNESASRAAAAACIAPSDNPLNESRMYAMAQLAVHDALNAIDRRAASYGPAFTASRRANPRAAVAAAAHDTLVSAISEIQAPFTQQCRDAGVALVTKSYADQLRQVPNGPSKRSGLAVGHRAADGIIALRRGDGAGTPLIVPDFPQSDHTPGVWRFTPGAPFAFAPGWGQVKPFALTSAQQFGTPEPLPLSSGHYARDLNEVKGLGGDGVTTPSRRSAEQTEMALFWMESSPTMWNRIGRQLAVSKGIDGWQQARLFGQLNMALADGYVATFSTKYRELYWRPVTAIQQADRDGNSRTSPDRTWTPLRPTPAIPDYDSGHSVEGGVAAGVLSSFFGTSRLHFSTCSDSLPEHPCGAVSPTTRSFHSVTQAAQENANSRIYLGFHFRYATEVGTHRGLEIGRWTASHSLVRQTR
jgi:PAP2 superfamily